MGHEVSCPSRRDWEWRRQASRKRETAGGTAPRKLASGSTGFLEESLLVRQHDGSFPRSEDVLLHALSFSQQARPPSPR